MQTSMFLDQLYTELQTGSTVKAANMVVEFLDKAAVDIEYFHYLNSLSLTTRNQVCLSFIDQVAKKASDQLWEDTPERIRSLIEK